jgi:electron transfer flavoprotein alpha subunit
MKAIHKSLGASAVYQIKKEAEARLAEMREKEVLAKVVKKEKERMGLEGGEKIGKYKVGKGRVDVQLGEDLAESLRQIKVSQPTRGVAERRMKSPRRGRGRQGECVSMTVATLVS